MKYKFILLTSILFCAMFLSACSVSHDSDTPHTTQACTFYANGTYTFSSFEDFEAHGNSSQTSGTESQAGGFENLSFYYLPLNLPESAELQQITALDGVYVSVEYVVPVDNPLQDFGVIAYTSHPGDAESHLKESVQDNSSIYTKLDYNGSEIYYSFDDARTVPTHCFSFICNGDFVSYCIPAEILIDGEAVEITVDDALAYSEMIRVDL